VVVAPDMNRASLGERTELEKLLIQASLVRLTHCFLENFITHFMVRTFSCVSQVLGQSNSGQFRATRQPTPNTSRRDGATWLRILS